VVIAPEYGTETCTKKMVQSPVVALAIDMGTAVVLLVKLFCRTKMQDL